MIGVLAAHEDLHIKTAAEHNSERAFPTWQDTKYRLYLVLDFINGGHLSFQLYHHGLFREDLARIYTEEIVSAVSHLHACGIMHRDLKPEDILLDADGHAILTDFGLAKELEENARSNSMCGTIEYMSPEIILGRGHDKAADWWSVGILLFEMLTGKPPFIGGNRERVQQKIIKDKIKLPSFLSSEAPSLLKGLLQKDPSKGLGVGQGEAMKLRAINGSSQSTGRNWRPGKYCQVFALKLMGSTALPTLIRNTQKCPCWILRFPVQTSMETYSTGLHT